LITRYTDHAANERTYLAWVRTALAFMGFGLLIERFPLVLGSRAASFGDGWHAPAGHIGGLALILLGVLVLGVSSVRYLGFKRAIADSEAQDFRSARTDLVLLVVVALIGVAMLVYVAATLA
jgi:putative membrane protein